MSASLKDFLRRLGFPTLSLLVAIGLTGCASSLPNLPPNSTRVPMRLAAGLPFVHVEISGRRHDFLLDTGASDCVITPQIARALGLPISREKAMVKSAAGDRVPIPMTVLPVLRIGASEFRNVPCFVHDCDKIRATFTNMEGVIGFGIFRQALLTLDYPGRHAIISPWRPLATGSPGVVEMRTGSGVPQVPVYGGDRSMFVDIDSGSTGGLEINPYQLGVATTSAPRPGSLSTSIGSSYRTGVARVAGPLFLGEVELDNPIVEVTRGEPRVGGEVLQNLVLTFDQRSHRAAISFGGGGLFSKMSGQKLISPSRIGTGIGFDREWNVHDVVPDSAGARAGIRVGDRCIMIQGRPASDWDDSYQDLLRKSSLIDFRFIRRGRTYDVKVPVVMQVQ